MNAEELPPVAVRKATNLIRDGRLAPVVGLIPVLGLIFILRLVQWYLLKNEYPALIEGEGSPDEALSRDFRRARLRLWLAVLLWPCAILLAVIVFQFS